MHRVVAGGLGGDGWTDFLVTNGFSPEPGTNALFGNLADGRFEDAAAAPGGGLFDGRGVPIAGGDGDGDLDVVVVADGPGGPDRLVPRVGPGPPASPPRLRKVEGESCEAANSHDESHQGE